MPPADPVDGISPPPRFDPDSGQWVRVLGGTGPQQEAGPARLHELLLRIARVEVQRRAGKLRTARGWPTVSAQACDGLFSAGG